jgi:protein-S-isoprenylcysteine O-methyltransferase Ste14
MACRQGIEEKQIESDGWIDFAKSENMAVMTLILFAILSLPLVALSWWLSAVFIMKKKGKISSGRKDTTLFGFEKTTELVECGIFGYIRHPMYGALLCLTWGILLRHIEVSLMIIALISTGACVIAAVIEEKENMDYFGYKYNRYQLKTKIFIPFIL